jgi:hypothetical protein
MRKIYITILLTILPLLVFSQGENDNWYFGDHAAVNFAAATPVVYNNSQMDGYEACGTVSDSSGNLLFYTNGISVWSREHQIMTNGTGLGGNLSGEQLAIARNPGKPDQYFIFTTAENSSGALFNIAYTIVDMSSGNPGINGQPLGKVLPDFKNIPVVNNLGEQFHSEAITVVPNPANNAFWILIPNGDNLYSFSLDTTGFHNGTPVISSLNLPLPLGDSVYYGIKASPKLTYTSVFSHLICISTWIGDPNHVKNRVLSFNTLTGQLTSDYSLDINSFNTYMPEFSGNGMTLFLGRAQLYAVDLVNSTASNVLSNWIYNSPEFIFALGLQRNKYNDIYIAKYMSGYLGKINNPNGNINAMSVDMQNINLGNGKSVYGLPPLIESPYDTTAYSPCMDNLTLTTTEQHVNFTYNVSKDITTVLNYAIYPDYNIVMNAGNSITLLPNTHIIPNSFVAKIVPCNPRAVSKQETVKTIQNKQQVGMVLELDREEKAKQNNDNLKIYPNPVYDILNIDSKSDIENVEIFDLSGRRFALQLNRNKINTAGLPSGVYNIYIKTKGGMVSKKFIKK